MFVMMSLSVRTPGKLKSLLDRGGNRTRDLWFASPMLYQLSYEVKLVRVGRYFGTQPSSFDTPDTKKTRS